MEEERKKEEHNKRIGRLVMQQVELKSKKVMKRTNSYVPQLDEFGDIDDLDVLKGNFDRIRRSYDNLKKRNDLKLRVADVAHHRLEKDVMASS